MVCRLIRKHCRNQPSLHNLKVCIFYVAIAIGNRRGISNNYWQHLISFTKFTFNKNLKNKTHSTESIPQEALVTGRRVRLGLERRFEGAPNPPGWRERNTNPLVRCWQQSGEILPLSIRLPESPLFPNIHKLYLS